VLEIGNVARLNVYLSEQHRLNQGGAGFGKKFIFADIYKNINKK
jgi:hypothetical protein